MSWPWTHRRGAGSGSFGRNQWDRACAAKGGDCKSCQGRGDENAGQEQARRGADAKAFNHRESNPVARVMARRERSRAACAGLRCRQGRRISAPKPPSAVDPNNKYIKSDQSRIRADQSGPPIRSTQNAEFRIGSHSLAKYVPHRLNLPTSKLRAGRCQVAPARSPSGVRVGLDRDPHS